MDKTYNYNHQNESTVDGIATPRELLFSVFIIGVLVACGCCIHGCIRDKITDHNLKVEQAIRIEDNEHFKHCIETSPGDAFCEGDLDAIDTVEDEKGHLKGKFWSLTRYYQEYRKHVYYTTEEDSKGRKYRKRHEYWSWDSIGGLYRKSCKNIMFCGITFPSNRILLDRYGNITHISLGYHKRYEYVTIDKHHHGTIFTTFTNATISEGSLFYSNMKPEEVAKAMRSGYWPIYIFWIFAIGIIIFLVFWFCMLNNKWLESKGR